MSGLEMRYFILKPGAKGKHGTASRAALLAYAYVIKDENPEFYSDLRDWIVKEHVKAQERRRAKRDLANDIVDGAL